MVLLAHPVQLQFSELQVRSEAGLTYLFTVTGG